MFAWLDWDSVFKWAGFLASLATTFGILFLIIQTRQARTAFRVEQEDRTEQLERHQTEQLDSLKRREGGSSTCGASPGNDPFGPSDRTGDN